MAVLGWGGGGAWNASRPPPYACKHAKRTRAVEEAGVVGWRYRKGEEISRDLLSSSA